MLDINSLIFLLLVGVGAMVQTITGFAMGLIIMGGVTILGLAGLAETAAVVSLISLANTLVALRRCYRVIDYSYVKFIASAMLPMLVLGVVLLDYFSTAYYHNLRMLLGGVIVASGVLLMLTPKPYAEPSGKFKKTLAGIAAGLMGGLYGAAGAPLAYLMYRQPLAINVVRASLLFLFTLSSLGRTVVVGVAGQLDARVLTLGLVAVPLVIVVTLVTARFSHLLPDALIRKCVFVLLILLGVFLMTGA
jgi:uncharacterized membrane protein YfcA